MRDIKDLKKNPMFNLSLSSKELFHSNFLAWIAEDEDTEDLFVSILVLFGLKEDVAKDYAEGIRNGSYIVKREYKNFDFCICEKIKDSDGNSEEDNILGQVILVLENKFKSIPYEKQLKKYQEDVEELNNVGWKNAVKTKHNITRWNKKYDNDNHKKYDCHFVLLSLAENVCGLEITKMDNHQIICVPQNGNDAKEWTFISYKQYSEKLLGYEIPNESRKSAYINDYASYVNSFCKYLKKELPINNLLDCKWTEKLSSKPELVAIRMDDVWQKLVANIIASYYSKDKQKVEFGTDCATILNNDDGKLHVDTGFSRGSAAFEVRVRIDENCLFGIQIQNGCYRRLLQTTQDKHKQNKDLFKDKISKIFDNNESWRNSEIWEEVLYPTKKSGKRNSTIPEGFCSYGDDFIYKYKKLTDKCTVEEVLIVIDEDINNVKSLFRN